MLLLLLLWCRSSRLLARQSCINSRPVYSSKNPGPQEAAALVSIEHQTQQQLMAMVADEIQSLHSLDAAYGSLQHAVSETVTPMQTDTSLLTEAEVCVAEMEQQLLLHSLVQEIAAHNNLQGQAEQLITTMLTSSVHTHAPSSSKQITTSIPSSSSSSSSSASTEAPIQLKSAPTPDHIATVAALQQVRDGLKLADLLRYLQQCPNFERAGAAFTACCVVSLHRFGYLVLTALPVCPWCCAVCAGGDEAAGQLSSCQ
jgi:hypothetical protein